MVTLYDKIKYNYKTYFELTDPTGRQEIEQLAIKLKPLENDIVNDPKVTITTLKSRNVFSDSFDPSLADKISKILSGRT